MAGPIRIAVLANASQARRELGSVANETSSLGSKIGKFGKAAGVAAVAGLAVAGAAAVKFGADSVKAASDAQQSLGATETVFGRFSKTVVRTSNDAATKYGLSANVYRENANLLGSLFKNQGVSLDQLGGKTEKMIGTAADLAATFGGTTSDAVQALGAAFKGEYDMLERYGISIKQSDVNARLAANGQDQLTGAALKAAEQQAKSALIAEQAAQANGAFARESNTLAHQQQVLGAQFDNIKAKIGTALLPILTTLLEFVNTSVLPNFGKVREVLAQVAAAFAPVVAFVKRTFAAFNGSEEAGTKMQQLRATVAEVWAAVQSIFDSAVSIIQSLWKSFGSTIVRYAKSTFDNMISIIRGAFKVVQGIFNVVAGLLTGDWRRVWDGIKQILSGAWSIIKGVVKQGWNAIRTLFSAGVTVLRGIWSRLWDGIKSLASSALGAVRGLVNSGWNALKGLTSAAWNALKGVVSSAWDAIKRAVSNGISNVLGLVRSLPGKITGALGDLGSLLYNAGRSILQGLIDGVQDMIGSLKGKLEFVTDLIPDWKGPRERDKRLLRPAGQLIMGGLVKGIQDGTAGVKKELDHVTGLVVKSGEDLGRMTVGTIGLTELSVRAATDSRITARRTTERGPRMLAWTAAGVADRAREEQDRLMIRAADLQLNELRALIDEIRGFRKEAARAPREYAREYQTLMRMGRRGRN